MEDCFTVRLTPDGRTFDVRPGETVLAAALRSGVTLKYGCLHGNCATCKYMVLDGEVDFGVASPYSLPPSEREDGWVLLCCATPWSDLEIRSSARQDPRVRPPIPPTDRTGRVTGTEHLGGSLWRLAMELEAPLDFYAGQYVQLGVPDAIDDWRPYSISTPPSQQPATEFIVRRIENGRFSGNVDRLLPGARVPVRGPYGSGYLREGDDPVILVCGGSGLAPTLSILEDAAERGDPRRFLLFYGARPADEVILGDQIGRLAQTLPDLTYTATVEEPGTSGWEGPVGKVTTALQRGLGDISGHDAYLCGSPPMCDSVSLLLEAKGIREERIFFDRFYAAT